MPLIKEVPDISNEFTPRADTLKEFFSPSGRGFYIPLYQRPYSWNSTNIEQLMDDLIKGVDTLINNEKSVTFLGTVILCAEQNKQKNIEPIDVHALPNLVLNVIDGQQRISTLALLATRLYKATKDLIAKFEGDLYEDIIDYLEELLSELQYFFCFVLATKKAEPNQKPVVIRGSHDEWSLNGSDDKYTSPVSNYIAKFIRKMESHGVGIPDKRTTLGRNLKLMDDYIEFVLKAHEQTETHISYPDAKTILNNIDEGLVWKFDREVYKDYILNHDYDDVACSNLSAATQLCMLYHYLFERACFSVIIPASEDWAFDIFQSLNATGTPLTAIETFKPLVVNTVNKYSNNAKFKGSKSEGYFTLVDKLYENNDTAEKKSKLTKELLNVFRLTYEGKSLSNHFSQQRKWLNDTYNDLNLESEQEEFLHRLSNLAKYWSNVKWFDPTSNTCFYGLNTLSDSDKTLTVLCVRYLEDASHRMADTLLSRFYALVIRNIDGSAIKFSQATKAITAFFTLWRSAFSNTGLDEVYRKLLEKNNNGLPNYSWINDSNDLSVEELKKYFIEELNTKGINDRGLWIKKASKNLRYDNARTVCRFALIISSHNTISDDKDNGLMKKGNEGVNDYFNHISWNSPDLKTIEHIAPQSKENDLWDTEIYSDQLEHSIGNLTLLPVNINSSLGKRSWEEKGYYYKHLALSDPDKTKEIIAEAKQNGFDLSNETLELLTSAKYASHIQPIVDFSTGGVWGKNIINKRASRICELAWDELYPWLS